MGIAEDLEEDNNRWIATLRKRLDDELTKAANALMSADKALAELRSNHVYDPDYADNAGGGRVVQAIQNAGLYTAAAQAMVQVANGVLEVANGV